MGSPPPGLDHAIWYLTAEGATSIFGHLYLYICGAHISTVTRRVSSPPGDLVFICSVTSSGVAQPGAPVPLLMENAKRNPDAFCFRLWENVARSDEATTCVTLTDSTPRRIRRQIDDFRFAGSGVLGGNYQLNLYLGCTDVAIENASC